MTLTPLTVEEGEDVGLLGATLNETRGTLTLHFRNRDEIWTLAPAGTPVDGSLEYLTFQGAVFLPPPEGKPS